MTFDLKCSFVQTREGLALTFTEDQFQEMIEIVDGEEITAVEMMKCMQHFLHTHNRQLIETLQARQIAAAST